MKKFLLRATLFGAILLAILAILIFCIPFQKKMFTYEYVYKMERLDSLPSPRLIFVGGSNVAFGINSPMIADSLKMNVHNMGLHASIGLKYMLEDLEPHLRKGDVVVIMPEWEQFVNLFNGKDEILTDVAIYSGFKSWRHINARQWMTILSNIPKHINNKMRFHMDSSKFNYTSQGFNEFGDEVSHYNYPHKKYRIPYIDAQVSQSSIDSFLEITQRFKDKGCEAHLLPPALIRSTYDNNIGTISLIEEKMRQGGMPFETAADRHVFADSLSFDTSYHMGKIAADSLSRMIIRELRSNGEFVRENMGKCGED